MDSDLGDAVTDLRRHLDIVATAGHRLVSACEVRIWFLLYFINYLSLSVV